MTAYTNLQGPPFSHLKTGFEAWVTRYRVAFCIGLVSTDLQQNPTVYIAVGPTWRHNIPDCHESTSDHSYTTRCYLPLQCLNLLSLVKRKRGFMAKRNLGVGSYRISPVTRDVMWSEVHRIHFHLKSIAVWFHSAKTEFRDTGLPRRRATAPPSQSDAKSDRKCDESSIV